MDRGSAPATPRSGFPPRAYLIGAQKAGTTSLARVLDLHPRITLSHPKEPDFFTGNWERGWDWYAARFAPEPGNAVLLDASTSYSMAPVRPIAGSRLDKVPERIAAACPDPRFIYVLRDPVERAWSAYWHAVRAGSERESFERAVVPDSVYIRASRYSAQLSHFHRFFPATSFLCIDFRDLKADIGDVTRRCLEFLDLPAGESIGTPAFHHNRSFVFNRFGSMMVKAVGGQKNLKQLNKALGGYIPAGLRHRIRSTMSSDIPPISEKQGRLLRILLEEEYLFLKDRMGFAGYEPGMARGAETSSGPDLGAHGHGP
jgi:hypothetical protein